jgi:hypothetical protein
MNSNWNFSLVVCQLICMSFAHCIHDSFPSFFYSDACFQGIKLSEMHARLATRAEIPPATAMSRIPYSGFQGLQGSDGPRRFTIENSGDPSQLPISHMCFNRIDLPPYYVSLEQANPCSGVIIIFPIAKSAFQTPTFQS